MDRGDSIHSQLFTRLAQAARITSIMAQIAHRLSVAGESLLLCTVAEPSVHEIEGRSPLKRPLTQQRETEVFHTQWLMMQL